MVCADPTSSAAGGSVMQRGRAPISLCNSAPIKELSSPHSEDF